jgi:hypothetical protein
MRYFLGEYQKKDLGGAGDEPYISLSFKTHNQYKWFIRKGNQCYPYFEFN